MFENWPAFYRSVYDPIWAEAEKDSQLNVAASISTSKN